MNVCDSLRQLGEALAHSHPEFASLHHFGRIRLPIVGPVLVLPKSLGNELIRVFIREELKVGKGSLTPGLAIMINDFVFENAAEPAANG